MYILGRCMELVCENSHESRAIESLALVDMCVDSQLVVASRCV